MKYLRAGVATLGFLLALVGCYFVHVRFFFVDVVFYAAIGDVIIAAFASSVVVMITKFFREFSDLEKILLFLVWLLIGYATAISVPTVIDRSLSFYILEKLQQRGGSIRQDGFAQVFKEEYLKEHRLVDVRLTEQLSSGTIIISDGCVLLTEKGARLASFSRSFRSNWLPRHRLLLGTYSDALVDPFIHDAVKPNYLCH